MKKPILLLLTAAMLLCSCAGPKTDAEQASLQPLTGITQKSAMLQAPAERPAETEEMSAEETEAPTEETEPQTEETELPVLVELSEEDQTLLLKIGMAELGKEGCAECIAMVMCTVLNRVESDRFSGSIRGVLYAKDQFTPVMDGTFETAVPNDICCEALAMVQRGWDESQGALFYEFCEGESWHSRNLQLVAQHCNTRFYQ